MICRFQDDELGEIAVPGFVPKLSETKSEIAWLGPSVVGAHNEAVYSDLLGLSEEELKDLENDGII
jgi:crotonobetainyl-CoA:carnitine CoA-transferase CaiB-like acyl-CoA transferase